ncbi:MAG: type IX secretion system sortase PorU [Ignavibacteria bacterium]
MSKLIKFSLVFLVIFSFSAFGQNTKKDQNRSNNNTKAPVTTIKEATKMLNLSKLPVNSLVDNNEPDYKIISSNSTYIEIEFYPSFQQRQQLKLNGQSFDVINFKNAIDNSSDLPGGPDIRSRYFPVYLPSDDRNVLSIIDYDENDVSGINLIPVPGYKLKNTSLHSYDFNNVDIVYLKDSKYYGANKFYPDKIAALSTPGNVRENVIANIVLSPYQYNPVTGTLKQYTRIRVRLTFGQKPVLLSRLRTNPELELLRGSAINSNIGINWINPKLNMQQKNASVFNSVMSTGDWYRIEIQDNGEGSSDGIYKMTKSFLSNAGIDLSSVDPRTIKMYGNGGDMLSSIVTDPRPVDLNEIRIFISNENSGHFGDNDYILFYGRSVNNWVYDSSTHAFVHYLNTYSSSNYYWIRINSPNFGLRMLSVPSVNTSAQIPSSFTERLFYEPEVANLNSEGNVWLSAGIPNGQSFVWNNTLNGMESNTNIWYRIKLASRVFGDEGYSDHALIREDNSSMSDIYYPMGTISNGYGDWIWTDTTGFIINSNQKTNGELSSFKATFFTDDPGGQGYLDWMEINYRRRLNSVSNDFLRIIDTNRNATVQYNVSPFSSSQVTVFDASDQGNVSIIQPLAASSSNVRFEMTQPGFSKYFVVGPNGYKTPTSISQRFANQNLHAISDGYDFIIISYKDFLPAANRLKAKREGVGPNDPSYLKTFVIDVDQIYNEFSGGLLDPVSIRDFLKYAYENWARKPAYVCLLGDGGFDYKNHLGPGGNYVPAFEYSDPNINQVNGYTSDDFFVQIEGNDPIPDIAHGRIPSKSLDESNGYLDKIDCYEDGHYNGLWKNKIMYVADDGWLGGGGDDGSQHTDQSEMLANTFTPYSYQQNKVYLVAYPPVITPQGRRKPSVNADIIKYINDGCIAVNWVGHGAPDVWAHEYVLERDVAITQFNNACKYPFLTVASCDFGKFDNPSEVSGAELFTISANKGTIGSLAATRPTYGQLNSDFNNTFWSFLYYDRDTLLLQDRFSTAVFKTKQIKYDQNSLKFELLCDPSVRDQYPRFLSRIDSMSGLANDTMRALSKIKIYGSVMHPDSTVWSDYNGTIALTVYDVVRHITIVDELGFVFNFNIPGGIIFSGTQTVKNGLWSIQYIVPKDLSYQNSNGRIIDYFYNNSYDGHNYFANFIVGGIDPDAAIDTTGPQISLYLNNQNFRSGDVVNENFTLIADMFDQSGINTTGTIGHKIEATLNNDINNVIDLTPYYNSDTTYQTGHLNYNFSGMAPGRYHLQVKAWDTYNNPSINSIDFTVSLSSSLAILNVYNFPNPFKDKTVFTFQHNYANPINVRIKIYTVAGRLIKEIDSPNISDKFVAIPWDGHDADGDRLSNGVYIYKLTVDAGNGSSVVNTGKLAVLR